MWFLHLIVNYTIAARFVQSAVRFKMNMVVTLVVGFGESDESASCSTYHSNRSVMPCHCAGLCQGQPTTPTYIHQVPQDTEKGKINDKQTHKKIKTYKNKE